VSANTGEHGPISISVVIPTHNRHRLLRRAVTSALAQDLPQHCYEVVVVDNASTDSTRETVEGFAGDPRIRYEYEPTLGLSHARNAGWRAARGELVAFLDDDAEATPRWLERILGAFETRSPRPGCVGGPVEAIWEGPRPVWLGAPLLTGLTIIDWGPHAHEVHDLSREWLVGANMAFPVELLRSLGGFAPGLDRSGERMLSGGDVHMMRTVQEAGHSCWYDPKVVVRHHVPVARLQKEWLMHRYYAQGLSDAAIDLLRPGMSGIARWRVTARAASKLPKALTRLVLPARSADRFTKKCFALIDVGHFIGMLTLPESDR
jgi:glycosyltransferase involved in cell wall biosynthesis